MKIVLEKILILGHRMPDKITKNILLLPMILSSVTHPKRLGDAVKVELVSRIQTTHRDIFCLRLPAFSVSGLGLANCSLLSMVDNQKLSVVA